jgi:hypothetical protein
MFSRLNHPVVTALITAVFYFIFLVFTLNQRDPGTFPQAGDFFTDVNEAPTNLIILTDSFGYDGQFYYRIALNPLTREKTEFGIEIGSPRYRHQRILYPLLAWLFSFGSPPMVIYALILVNFLALIMIGYAAGKYAQQARRHALLGLAFALYPGFLYTLSRDLVEITEAALILLALVTLARQKTSFSTTLLSLAVLAKETALLTAVSLISQKKYWTNAVLPLAMYSIWQLFLNVWWGYGVAETTSKNVGWPIIGIVEGYQIGYEQGRWPIAASLLGLFFLTVLVSVYHSTAERHIKVAWLLYTLLLISLTKNVWIESLAFLRAASLFYLFGTAVLLKSHTWIAIVCFIGTIATWLWLATDILLP